ncbi:MAG TPA: glycosyltransferase family 2 protein [Methanolinea sp.]|nr:glycosyltransferase family 2 protein [Methanolinea sp.]
MQAEYLIVEPKESEFTSSSITNDKLPLVSFCIPTKNNEDTLEKCLASIVNQNYPNLEIIIVDGYSTDNTISIAKRYTKNIFFDSGKLGEVRQKSINFSNGEIIALFDSDIVIPHRNWLINALKFFNYSDNVSTIWPKNTALPNSSNIQKLYFNLWEMLIENRIKTGKGFLGGGNSLFLRRCLEEIYEINKDIHWGEDFDLSKKLREKGYSVIFLSDPLYHDTMRTLKQFYQKQFVGAKTFTQTGFHIMGLSIKDVFFEHFIIGFKGMFIGLLVKRDLSWLYYPFLLFARLLPYTITTIKNIFQNTEVTENEQ